ncbi:SGNH/GDSL hydrolase family protein [Aeromicrobium sp. A1-2]|uniref:SGNH/GDSL hydrolase family protein n=1 Tax=Aeromicrobium sp. A1-2 TaxID=2107713 RepID=UPI000E55042C|nr:SGNH/GDSL hydrolase family protein [Aeromicrobium sp. A1-2]AXT86650.1 SGNH/GDSL hydrolase family protein [Aeromicrobium sp. A1-2]
MPETSFDYSNLSGRPVGPAISFAGRFLRGVREVQTQVEPYAHEWERHNQAAAAAAGPLWVVLGDSMAQSIGASAYDRGWAGQLAATLPDHRLVNLSVSGGRVADLLERQLPAMESLGVEPDLVTVVIGSNDLFSRRWRAGLPGRLAELLPRLPLGAIVATQPGGRPGSLQFNRQLDEAAAEGSIRLAEFRTPLMRSWKGRLSADHFHPNDLGYAGMAQILASAVSSR